MTRSASILALLLAILAAPASAQRQPDAKLLAEIRAIRAIDNHAHLPPVGSPDAVLLPADGSVGKTPFTYPTRLRVDNREWIRAWNALYGLDVADMTRATAERVLERNRALMRERGDNWAVSILDAVSIERVLLNARGRGTGQPATRFDFVPHADGLLSPFGEAKAGASTTPDTLDRYVDTVIRPALHGWKRDGAVAVKLISAYERSLDFSKVDAADARRRYAAHVRRTRPASVADTKALQDHLFRVLAREAGKAGLAMHIHTGVGADPWFRIQGANPLLLEDALGDPDLRATKFVLIHGGWPFDREAGAMLIKPNVWADFSAHTFLRSPRDLARTLRDWLEWYPEKVLFGTDAYPDPATPLSGWEEMLWLANDSARFALTLALTDMIDDGLVTRARALEIARGVLRDNARALYELD